MSQPPLIDLPPDEAPSERLVLMWRLYGRMPAGHVCGDCAHYSNRMCLLNGASQEDWRKDGTACGLWEYAADAV